MIQIRNGWAATAFLAALCMSSSALSAEIGRANVNGREIIINDDNTWAYAETTARKGVKPSQCTEIRSEVLPVAVCLDPGGWVLGNLEGGHEHSFRRKDEDRYMMVITEKDFYPQQTLRDAILINAQKAAGLNKVNVLSETTEILDGKSYNRLVYRTKVDTLDVTYDNFYTGFEGEGSVQLVFFALTSDYDAFKPIIEQTIDGVITTK